MLAQNFKTPIDLEISDVEFEALVKVLGMLEREELTHTNVSCPVKDGFNMGEVLHSRDCGTVACICGWAHLVSNRIAFPQVEEYSRRVTAGWSTLPEQLYKLFFPSDSVMRLNPIKPAQAAVALRNYLTSGEPRWSEALAIDIRSLAADPRGYAKLEAMGM